MIQEINVKDEINDILKNPEQSYEHIAAGVGVSSMTVRRWHKGSGAPKSRVVIKSIENYKKTLIQR